MDVAELLPTPVYDAYWQFAAERFSILAKRLAGAAPPWTADPILAHFRFTNVFRISDRVSQFLIQRVQASSLNTDSTEDIFFRTILFKIFNKISTWRLLELSCGRIYLNAVTREQLSMTLTEAMNRGQAIYSNAYIMPSPDYGYRRKHDNHLAQLYDMIANGVPQRLSNATSLSQAYSILAEFRGIGEFLAYQYAIDLNYSPLLNFDEDEFVVAGPGARDGIAKCFRRSESLPCEDIIRLVSNLHAEEFARRGLTSPQLHGRPLKLVDYQNLFCEVSKYARVAYPDELGGAGRKRIKQRFNLNAEPLGDIALPEKWMIQHEANSRAAVPTSQGVV